MDFTHSELDLLYCVIRHEAIELRKGDWQYEPEQGSYEDKIFELDKKLSASFHKRNHTIR
jgi:hypothetical protein